MFDIPIKNGTNLIEKILRTPDERYAYIRNFPYTPKYIEAKIYGNNRIYYIDEGNSNVTILIMHGEPSWKFLFRDMILF